MCLFLYLQICIKVILVATEVITLIKDDEITCISTEDTVNSPMYMDKFDQPYSLTRSVENIENLNLTDWKPTNDTKNFEPVTDERWTDFKSEILQEKFLDLLTWSVCINATLNVEVASRYYNPSVERRIEIEDPNISSSCKWIHLRITKQSDSNSTQIVFQPLLLGVRRMSECRIPITFEIEWLLFDSVYKIHTYNFWDSTTISLKKSHIDVKQPHECISMYVSVDKGCFLNVTLLSGNETVTNVVNGTNKGNLKSWIKLEIATTERRPNGTLYFFRGRYDNRTIGYWAVSSIEICNNLPVSVARMTLPKYTNADDDLICKNLIKTNSIEQSPIFCEKPSFGKNCNITCAEVLGVSFSNCEKYRIKLGNESHCAWGYVGPNCTQACDPDYWGMDCKNECGIGCANCNATLGCTKCKSTYLPTNCSQKLPVVTQAPTMLSLTNSIINIFCNLTYGEDEIYPDSYIIQYKHGDENFTNYTEPRNYTSSVNMNINITRQATCRVRIILLHKQFSVQSNINIPELIVHKELLQVENVSVYGVEDDELFVRWTEPYPRTGKIETYILSLKDNVTGHTVNISTKPANCHIWKKFICAKIPGVTNLTSFEVKVRPENQNVPEWGQLPSLRGVVRNETSAPEEVRINASQISPPHITLTWKHPVFIYGTLKFFRLNMTDGYQSRVITKNVTTSQEKYNEMISVERQKKYSISIWAINSNNEGGEKVHVFLWVSRSIPDFSRDAFINWYSDDSKKYFLILPKPNKGHVNFNVTVSKKDEKVICSNNICEFNGTSEDENVTYFLNYGTKTIIINSIVEEEWLPPGKENLGFVPILTSGVIFVSFLVGYLCYAFKKQKFPFQKRKNQEDIESYDLQEKDALLNKSNENYSTPINIENLEKYISELLELEPDRKKITQQFLMIPTRTPWTCNLGRLRENIHKNRYENTLPYDVGRVILRGNGRGDYINASYVNTLKAPKEFIAAQAPLESTIHDFWFMVCQENVKIIVMLMKQEENDGTRCAQYWPSNSSYFRYGKFLIEIVETNVTADYTHRKLQVKFQDQTNLVQHYQYTAWSDNDVPLYIGSFTSFVQEVMRFQQNFPIIVHCDSGCDRTGTFILCCVAIEMGRRERQVDFHKLLKELRESRPNMLGNIDQYIFAHYVILKYFFGQYEYVS